MTVFHTTVRSIGSEADLFKEEKLVILFGKEAPEALADYCYTIEVNATTGEIEVGQSVIFDNQSYQITSVGNLVRSNLEKLGHITIRFDGSTTPELPGTLYVEEKEMPNIIIGTNVTIQ